MQTKRPAGASELTLLIAERASWLAREREFGPGRELELWLEAEAQVKRALRKARAKRAGGALA